MTIKQIQREEMHNQDLEELQKLVTGGEAMAFDLFSQDGSDGDSVGEGVNEFVRVRSHFKLGGYLLQCKMHFC